MPNRKKAKTTRHQEVWELLPWYVAGTLKEPDRGMVAHHISECSACADELAKCRIVASALRDSDEVTEWTPSPEEHVSRFKAYREDVERMKDIPMRRTNWVQDSAASTNADIDVVVADDITDEEFLTLLGSVAGIIVEGPSPTMAYTVRVPFEGKRYTAALETLRAHPKVRQAKPQKD